MAENSRCKESNIALSVIGTENLHPDRYSVHLITRLDIQIQLGQEQSLPFLAQQTRHGLEFS